MYGAGGYHRFFYVMDVIEGLNVVESNGNPYDSEKIKEVGRINGN